MQKEFVPYELALRMKQLGFDERCFKYEDAKKICENHEQLGGCPLPNVHCGYPNCTIDRSVEPLAIPIWQQAFGWLIPQIDDEYRVCLGEEGWYVYNLENNTIYENEKSLEKLIEIVEQIKSE